MQGSRASLKVLEFFSPKFKALKVLENRRGAWKSLNFIPQVLEFTKSYCAISAALLNKCYCLKQDLLIIVMFCFYPLKLSRNHRNRYYMLL